MNGAIDFRGRRPGNDRMPVTLLLLKMLIFLKFIPTKQGFHSSTSLKVSEMQELKLFQDERNFSGASCYVAVKVCFFAANLAMYMM